VKEFLNLKTQSTSFWNFFQMVNFITASTKKKLFFLLRKSSNL